MPYNPRKAAQTIAFFLLNTSSAKLDMLKIVKLVYLADRESLATFGFPIQTEKRVSLRYGPVNSDTYNILKGKGSDTEKALWSEFLNPTDGTKVSLSNPDTKINDLDELSDNDLTVLEGIWAKFGAKSASALVTWTHKKSNVPEWKNPGNSSREITLESMMEAVETPNAEAQLRLIRDHEEVDLLFKRLS